MLACYLAEEGEKAPLQAAVVVSAPLMLAPCSRRLETGTSRLYHHYLLSQLKQSVLRKQKRYPQLVSLTEKELKGIRSLEAFDDAITAPLHGFSNAQDYYYQCSALPMLPNIKTPLLIVHAKDDPFMSAEVIPDLKSLPAILNIS